MNNYKQFELTLTLLDDLHTGSGLGDHQVDAFQARDRHGYPVISRQHFKGVLNTLAQEWLKLKLNKPDKKPASDISVQQDATRAAITHLFNDNEGEKHQVHLVFGSFYLDSFAPLAEETPYIIWSSSARGKEHPREETDSTNDNLALKHKIALNRAPKDKTLRSVEYVKAGAQFTSTLTLFAPQTSLEDYSSVLEELLKRVTRLGAKRHRGAGGVTLDVTDITQNGQQSRLEDNQASRLESEPHTPSSSNLSPVSNASSTLKITLKNTEPLRLPDTQQPGNIIPTQTYIASNKLRGALANTAKLLGKQSLFDALVQAPNVTQSISISAAYPKPNANSGSTFPWPQNMQQAKSEALKNELPWWVTGPEKAIRDAFFPNESARKDFKRNKSPSYVTLNDAQNLDNLKKDSQQRDKQTGYYFTQDVSIHMRNKVGSRDELRNDDDSELFSEEVLPENGYFDATFSANTATLSELHSLFNTLQQASLPLCIGRGKAPCIIESISQVSESTPSDLTWDNGITLVLTSDWLIYDPQTLTPYTQLNAACLNTAFKLDLNANEQAALEEGIQSFTETAHISGFNFATQLPTKPVNVICAGSALHIPASVNSSNVTEEVANKLLIAIKQHQHVGERTLQGCGRYLTYQGELSLEKHSAETEVTTEKNHRETLIQSAEDLMGSKNIKGSLSQWQAVKSYVQAMSQLSKPTSDLKEYVEKLQKQTQKGKLTFIDNNTLFQSWEEKINTALEDTTDNGTDNIYKLSLHLLDAIIDQMNTRKTTNQKGV